MSRPAPAPRAVAALASLELRLLARRGESLLVTLVIPVAVLLFFAGMGADAGLPGERIAFLLPGAIALAIFASGLVSLGIATAYERQYGVLKRLGGAPIGRGTLVAAKALATAGVVLLQVTVLVAVAALVLGWAPGQGWSPPLLVGGLVLGVTASTGLGLLLAGTLRADAVLALANGLFLAFLMLGGILLPVTELPGPLQPLALALPATALADLLRVGLDGGHVLDPRRSLVVLVAWVVVAVLGVTRTFRWD